MQATSCAPKRCVRQCTTTGSACCKALRARDACDHQASRRAQHTHLLLLPALPKRQFLPETMPAVIASALSCRKLGLQQAFSNCSTTAGAQPETTAKRASPLTASGGRACKICVRY